jgi:hypothetical protein
VPIDRDLWEALRRCDPEALGTLFTRYAAVVHAYAVRHTGSYSTADGAVQAGGLSFVKSRNLDAANPVNGQWTFTEVHDGKALLLFVDFAFSALPALARVELRIRYTDGASPWYGASSVEGSGYVQASQWGAIHDRRATEVDYRAIDRNSQVVFTSVEYG